MKRLVILCLLPLLTGCPSPPPSPNDAALARATLPEPPLPVDSQRLTDTLARAGRPSTVGLKVDTTTFPYPVLAGMKTAAGYPVYLLRCDTSQCMEPSGVLVGSRPEVAARLTPVRNVDVRNPIYQCDWVCIDLQGHVVGAISPEMRAFLKLPALPPLPSPSSP